MKEKRTIFFVHLHHQMEYQLEQPKLLLLFPKELVYPLLNGTSIKYSAKIAMIRDFENEGSVTCLALFKYLRLQPSSQTDL